MLTPQDIKYTIMGMREVLNMKEQESREENNEESEEEENSEGGNEEEGNEISKATAEGGAQELQ